MDRSRERCSDAGSLLGHESCSRYGQVLTLQAKVRLQAKSSKPKSSSSSASPPTLGPALTSNSEKGTYAEIASHPASSSAPVIEHNPDLDLEDAEKGPTPLKSTINVGKKVIDGGAIELLTRVYREKGFLGWYKGLGAQIVKAVLCQGTSHLFSFHSPHLRLHLRLHFPCRKVNRPTSCLFNHWTQKADRRGKGLLADVQVSYLFPRINSNHIPSSSLLSLRD